MESYLIYIGKAALAAGTFYLLYLALFQHQKQFVFNRIYLPVSLAISFLIPLITFTTVKYIEPVQTFASTSFAYLPEATEIAQPEFVYQWYHYLTGIYLLGIIGFLFHLILGHYRAISIIRFSRLKELFGVKINVSNKDIHPFSFFNKIVLSNKTLDNPNLKIIVNHEKIHVDEKHTLDILFAEILFLFQWFNPFAWLIKAAMRNNLEYKTDHQIAQTNNAEAYQLAMVGLAHKKGVAPFLTALNGSQLKNRIVMMKKKTENKYALLKQLVVLPLLAVLVMGLSNKEVKTEFVQKENQTEIFSLEKSIKGKVTDQNGYPISGASVVIKGKPMGTITNKNGNYIIEISDEDKTLVFGFLDIDKKEVSIGNKTKINVQLDTTKKSNKKDTGYRTGNLYDGTLRIRNSEGEMAKPLYIVDGEEKESLEDLSPGDILSMSELRNESAVTFYGKKGKNGVIQIATKNWKFPADTEPLVIVDGKEFYGSLDDIPKDEIYFVRDLRYPNFTQKYGEKGKNGVVEIETTKMRPVPELIHNDEKKSDVSYSFSDRTDLNTLEEIQKIEKQNKNYPIFYKVEEMPEFPGGELALRKYIAHSIKYPTIAQENGIQGKVYVTFIIDKNGKVNDPQISKGVDPVLDKEALRVVHTLPRWKPGKQKGKTVNVSYTVPINFRLMGNQELKKNKANSDTESEEVVVVGYGEQNSVFTNEGFEIKDVFKNEKKIISVSGSAENQPLYVVDGKIVANIEYLDPNEIESVSVLKDKSATNIYGDKGKNGVVVVNTEGSGVKGHVHKIEDESDIKVTGFGTQIKPTTVDSHVDASKTVFLQSKKGEDQPLYIVDGEEIENLDNLHPTDMEKITVLKDESAIALYGEKGKNGVIIITTHEAAKNKMRNALVIVDGKEYEGDVSDIDPANIESMDVLKNESATKLYGEKAKDGAIIITSKNRLKFGDNSPLIIIDGVKAKKDVNDIDPETIESISVLKDASALAYDPTAKNGVILITTKNNLNNDYDKLPVVLNGKLTSLTLNETDRDLIQNIIKVEPGLALIKYGDKGKNGVYEVTSRKLYTEKVDVKSTAELEQEKITTELELRKFIAEKIKYPVKAQEANEQGTTLVYVEFDESGVLIGPTIKGTKKNIILDEVVVTALKNRNPVVTGNASKSEDYNKLLLNETKEIVDQLPTVKIPEFKGQTVAISVKYVLQ